MNILCIDTSGAGCSVALSSPEKTYSLLENKPQAHSERVLMMCESLLEEAKLKREDLDALGVTRGPGSFTGVRIGISVAQGICYALNIPAIPVSSLAILAQQTHKQYGVKKVFCIQDARMNEVYYGAYNLENGIMVEAMPEGLAKPEQLSSPSGEDWYSAGNAWLEYGQKLSPKQGRFEAVYPHTPLLAEAILPFARKALVEKLAVSPSHLEPVYLRNKVADKVHESQKT